MYVVCMPGGMYMYSSHTCAKNFYMRTYCSANEVLDLLQRESRPWEFNAAWMGANIGWMCANIGQT